MMAVHRRGPWSQREDMLLLQLVSNDGASNWVRISHTIGTRSPKQCRERFHQNLKPTLNHDPITPEEGEQIEKMVNEMGKRWAEIARRLKGRSDNAVKNWWNGGQNRRRRGHEHRRSDSDRAYVMEHQQQPQYFTTDHELRRTSLPALDTRRYLETVYYPQQHYVPQQPMSYPIYQHAHHPQVQANRPAPLNVQLSSNLSVRHAFDTPLPSPSVSIISGEGAPPSLVTDNGSETRSPNYTNSPHDTYTLPPTIGGRDERRRSSVRYLPKAGFAGDGDDFNKVHLAPITRSGVEAIKAVVVPPTLQLPSPQCMVQGAPADQSPQLRSSSQLVHCSLAQGSSLRDMNYSLQGVSSVSPYGASAEPRKMALSSILT